MAEVHRRGREVGDKVIEVTGDLGLYSEPLESLNRKLNPG